MNKSCIIVGGGPSNKAGFEFAQAWLETDPSVWACNDAMTFIERPDVIVCTDPANLRRHQKELVDFGSAGVKIYTWQRVPLELRNVPVIKVDYEFENQREYSRDRIAHGRAVGLVAIQLALREGYTDFHLCGFDGYEPDAHSKHQHRDKIIETLGRAEHWKVMNELMLDVMTQIAQDRTDCSFTFYVRSRIAPSLPNVRMTYDTRPAKASRGI